MSASRCTSVELSLSVVVYFFSNKIENDKLKEPGFPPQKCYICITFSNIRTVISDCDLPTEKKPESSYSFLLLCFDFPLKKE